MRKKPKPESRNATLREQLRAMPIDQRAEIIVDIFRLLSSEFAAMVLDHVKPAKAKPRAKAKPGPKMRRRMDRR
ncbi:MAG TPA: hypothetical protein VK630_04220 [Reyranella sp.]|nr:hypothetical protein [Reyranella sp.]